MLVGIGTGEDRRVGRKSYRDLTESSIELDPGGGKAVDRGSPDWTAVSPQFVGPQCVDGNEDEILSPRGH